MRIGAVLIIVWLVIGVVAAEQRGYYNDLGSCTKVGTTVVTILAGPLNYLGVNPRVDCGVPKPSK
jgi:hypothetical protein